MDLSLYDDFFRLASQERLEPWAHALKQETALRLQPDAHGDLLRWWEAFAVLPDIDGDAVELDVSCVRVQSSPVADATVQVRIRELLQRFHPWRKGPFDIHGVEIDTEWRSDWKWDRLADRITPLTERTVLDVGCGNGYHCWRMAGAGAELVLGIDPTILYVMQYLAIAGFLHPLNVAVLPFALEDLPEEMTGFDTVFSMGVLYHRRSPLDHLVDLRRLLRSGGELVLETLVLEGEEERVLVPPGRYAQMRNVWFIPTADALIGWLGRCGFRAARLVDITATSVREQRATDWMRFQSLADFLDPNDATLTVEGLPAPKRGIFIAEAG